MNIDRTSTIRRISVRLTRDRVHSRNGWSRRYGFLEDSCMAREMRRL